MKKILITGGAGYIGSVLSRKLLNLWYIVTIIDNFIYDQNLLIDLIKNNRFNIINGNILDYEC